MVILPLNACGRDEFAQRGAVLVGGLLPVLLNWVPAVAQALDVGIAILRDQRGDALRMPQRKTETDRRAVIKDINCVASKLQRFHESVDHTGQVFEGVVEA